MAKKNLSRDTIRLLRKVQKFLIDEPRRFDMTQGITKSCEVPVLEQPPCGTACCIAGSMYVLLTGLSLDHTSKYTVTWFEIMTTLSDHTSAFKFGSPNGKLFYLRTLHSGENHVWPAFYEEIYFAAKTPLQRACVGVARIEHFIATDGAE